jgi:hypothetical protein
MLADGDSALWLCKGHGARHTDPVLSLALMWSREARAELGMWNGGELELRMGPNGVPTAVPRQSGLLNGEKYAARGAQDIQRVLRCAIVDAARSLVPDGVWSAVPLDNSFSRGIVEASLFYRKH